MADRPLVGPSQYTHISALVLGGSNFVLLMLYFRLRTKRVIESFTSCHAAKALAEFVLLSDGYGCLHEVLTETLVNHPEVCATISYPYLNNWHLERLNPAQFS